ncbi:choice-of-anchor Q domain-containing protein [Kallotenue papyrolyticum]|uniref:choice-of-anchor Q domain-containing protein n=1 Tax=Kallotenue papyrolyticum TaxID=1325125 RepID=UPI00047861C3|nr:choice-of-anchor Q domain-containing protein [Kallotenue papyrolyticum]
MRSLLSLVAVFIVVCAALPSQTPTVYASSITVNITNDGLVTDGRCTLREAIQAVNAAWTVGDCATGGGYDVITLPSGFYQLSLDGADEENNATGDLDIFSTTSSVPRMLTIRGSGATTTIIDGNRLDRVFHLVGQNDRLVLRNLTVRNGRLPTPSRYGGAGVLSWGHIELYNVIIENNASSDVGGGLCIGCGASTGSGYLENVIIRNNTAQRGGGIFTNQPLTITASSIISNSAAVAGGAIVNYDALALTNVTVSANTADNNTGGIRHEHGSLSVLNSTISHNTRAGIRFLAGATLKNTLLASNSPEGNCSIFTPPTSQGHNLSSDTSCASAFTASGDLNNVDPQLGPLQQNGGLTPTRALPLTSPAVNAGTNSGCPATDQRGIARPQVGTCDIGAYELVVQRAFMPLISR